MLADKALDKCQTDPISPLSRGSPSGKSLTALTWTGMDPSRPRTPCVQWPAFFLGPFLGRVARGPKKHINFFNINFLPPAQNTPFWTPRKKLTCLISWERTQKRDPHKLSLRKMFEWQKRAANGPFLTTKSLVYCFFPALSGLLHTSCLFQQYSEDSPKPKQQIVPDQLPSRTRIPT